MQDQEAYLQYEDTGKSASNADAMLKRHDEFTTKLLAQDEKLKTLGEQMTKLREAREDATRTFEDLSSKRQKLKAHAQDVRQSLLQAKQVAEFRVQRDDLSSWIDERVRAMPSDYAPQQIGIESGRSVKE